MLPARPRRLFFFSALAAVIALAITLALSAADSASQSNSYDQVSEIAATLASGQVTVIAARDGLVVAVVGRPFEPGDLPPQIVPLGSTDLAVALGAIDWVEPPSNRPVLQLASSLPGLIHGLSGNAPRLSTSTNLSRLDKIGLGVLEQLRQVARNLRSQLHLPKDLPLAELILVRHPFGSSGDVWDISYWLRQRFLESNFWNTEVERPRYTHMFPRKDDQSGLIELNYPPGNSSPGPIEWLSRPASPLAKYIATHPKLIKTQRLIAEGKGRKTRLSRLVPLVKTALETMAPASEPKAMAVIDSDHGFSWVIQPPPPPKHKQSRPPGAPTLGSQPHN